MVFIVELWGLVYWFNQFVGWFFSWICVWELGDQNCQVDFVFWWFFGMVIIVVDWQQFIVIGLGVVVEGVLQVGLVIWLMGVNIG